MQTLEQLKSGKLNSCNHLKLSCNLNVFPKEIFNLTDTLEILDLSNNQLSELPENFFEFKKLKIAFFSENNFTEFPSVLAKCPNLTMIGFKSNKITHIPENSFPINLQWLILTNNKIIEIPKSIGKCIKLQKVAFAGNQLNDLPIEMANCKNIELLRISANNIAHLPHWLFTLPRLAWLAFSGNPCSVNSNIKDEIPLINWNELSLSNVLGQGASGIISKAEWTNNTTNKTVAIKVFKGDVTSDGFPEDEMNACIKAGNHPNLVKVIGKIKNHPDNKMGLVLELLPPNFKNLGNPPSFDTCTRDVFDKNIKFSLNNILKICSSVASALSHIHQKGIMHGDLYAHNTLINEFNDTIIGDFGAATTYLHSNKNALLLEKIDVRAFGYFIEDLLNLIGEETTNNTLHLNLLKIKNNCLNENIDERPSFNTLKQELCNQ
jgi:hypothetical protein